MAVRVYEFAKKHSLVSRDIVTLLQEEGFDVSSHMAVLTPEALAFLETHYGFTKAKKAQKNDTVAKVEITESVNKEKVVASESHNKTQAAPQKKHQKPAVKQEKKQAFSHGAHHHKRARAEVVEPQVPKEFILEAMSLQLLSEHIKQPISALIMHFLKQGKAYSVNDIVPVEIVKRTAQDFGVSYIEKSGNTAAAEKHFSAKKALIKSSEGSSVRPPVVVVMGHVDHGKTTLLDYIRKTHVASREKGGITQHIGASVAKTKQGDIVFLDTPGHEAFSMMRTRGVQVADIAILVVAADDGIMPQTIEALNYAKQAGVPIIVAINKIDKPAANLEGIKTSLAQHELLPEEWGGDTICVPISALKGTNIDTLLEMVVLQAEMMELKTDLTKPAAGFVVESHLERGLGPVATIICHTGTLRVKDYFSAGEAVHGRVTSLVTADGKRVKEIPAPYPVQVSGFSTLPEPGSAFMVGDEKSIKRGHVTAASPQLDTGRKATVPEGAIKLLVKADTISTLQALEKVIGDISKKAKQPLVIVEQGVGSVTENDLLFAENMGCIIYSLHVKSDSKITTMARSKGIKIRSYDIIYALIDDIIELEKGLRPKEYKVEKTGTATVLKVFRTKKFGTIAGARVLDGSIFSDGILKIFRNNKFIGSGKIASLQRENNNTKEVKKGFECAFIIDGFTDWQESDLVECEVERLVSTK